MVISEKGNNHGLQDSVDSLSGIFLSIIHRISGVDNTQALARLLNQAVRELGARSVWTTSGAPQRDTTRYSGK